MGRGETSASDDLGEPIRYDPDFHGPLKHRSCTDVICLFIFIIFIGCWIGIGIFAFASGNPDKLLIPRDSSGSRCGYDGHVRDKPYLFFFDLTKCINPTVAFTGCNTTQVCVEQCPTKTYYYSNQGSVDDLICQYNVIPTPQTAQSLISEGQCAQWAIQSTDVLKRCLPSSLDVSSLYNITASQITSANHSLFVLSQAEQSCLLGSYGSNPWSCVVFRHLHGNYFNIGYDIVSDILSSWKEILLGIGICIVGSIIYIFILRWVASILVWLSIFAAIGALAFCVYWTSQNYIYYKDNPNAHEDANWLQAAFMKSGTWLGLLIAFSVILGILVLVVIFLRKRIVLAIALIKEGSKAVSACTSSLFFPILPWCMQLGVIAYVIAVAIYLSTVGHPSYEVRNYDSENCIDCNPANVQNGMSCNLETFGCSNKTSSVKCPAVCKFIQTTDDAYVTYLHIFNGVGLFWGVFFISALCEMILASTFATWYWTFKKSNVPFFTVTTAALRTVRYHLGTLAFGSLIITICRIIRVILEYIDHKLKKYDNPVTRAIMCCLKCFFWCLEKFLRFINRNAYIMCAIHGKNFCISAKNAFSLLMRNILRVFVLDKITDFIFFLSKMAIVIGVSASIYAIVVYVRTEEITYVFVPVIFVAICAYFICSAFFKVYTMAIDTLFLCFLEDSERNDGSPEKPFFMSKNLMKILNKKNK